MKVWLVVVLCSLAILSGGSDVTGEAVVKSGIAFGLPFKCPRMHQVRGVVDATDNCKGRCLADSFKPGLSVALVGKTGVCRAKTGGMCTFNNSYGPAEVTQLVGTHRCLAVRDGESLFKNEPFCIAVVDVDPAAVRKVSPSHDRSSLPKDAILWARQLLESSESPDAVSDTQLPAYRVSEPPQVVRVKNVVLLKFELVQESRGQERALLLLVNNRLFQLGQHGCPSEYAFFTVHDKLLITFWDGSCGSGVVDKVVYDLSGEIPKLVYVNGAFEN
jgi:hypothetical protein